MRRASSRASRAPQVWHKVAPLFASFRKGAAEKARITDAAQIKGLDGLKAADKKRLTELIGEEQAFRAELDEADAAATRLEHTKDGGVFWQISQTGNSTRTKWGPVGTSGSVTEKEHADDATAEKYVAKMVEQKLKGGYTRK